MMPERRIIRFRFGQFANKQLRVVCYESSGNWYLQMRAKLV